MTTSLADQLKRFSKPQTSNLERGKVRPSLLFDPKEAAGIRKEIFYEIGLKGLEELIERDEAFENFTKTLFSLEAKNFERSIELEATNDKLNKQIRKFLLLLSPYILLSGTHKALEWLIYRYSIHQYNREDFLMLVLPYHETRIFQRVIALMKFEEVNDPWAFLKQMQISGVPLTNHVLLNHAASDSYFIKFVSDFMLKIIKIHEKPNSLTVAFNFFNQVFIGAIEYCKGTPEAIITQMLPAILKGLNSDILDFRAAAYIITARLVTKCTLSDVLLDKFLLKISDNDGIHLKTEAVLLYAILYQGQPHYKSLPDEALAKLSVQQTFPKTLQELNSSGTDIYPFLEVLVKKLVVRGIATETVDVVDHYREFLTDLLDELNIQEESVAIILNAILDSLPLKVKGADTRTWISELIGKLEVQYPTQFDQQVYKILTLTENQDRKIRLEKILKGVMRLQKKFDIFSKLYDSNALIRVDAVKFILTHFDELREEEKDILKISLEHRLKDDSFDVVKEALGIIAKTKIIQGVGLNKILCQLLSRCYKDKHCQSKILIKVLKLLCVEENSNNFDIITIVFPLLLPKTNGEIDVAKLIINTPLFRYCPLFKKFNHKSDLKIPGDFPNEIFECLKSNQSAKIIVDSFFKTDSDTLKTFSAIQKYSAALLLSNSVSKNSSLEDVLPLLDILEKISPNEDLKSTKSECSILESIKMAKRDVFPLSGYLECIYNMVICINKIDLEKLDFTSSSPTCKFLLSTSSILYLNSEIHQGFSDKFNDFVFKTVESTIDFMLHLVVFKECHGSMAQNMILDILLKKFESSSISGFFDLKKNYVPYILILLTSQDDDIRKKAFQIGDVVMKYKTTPNKKTYFSLFEYLMKHQEEIVLDSDQLPVMVSNCLKTKEIISKQISTALVNFCCSAKNPLYSVAGMTKVLSGINDNSILENISTLALSVLEKNSKIYSDSESYIISNCVRRYNETVAKNIKTEQNAFKFLISALKNDKECLNIDGESISPALLTIKYLNESFFSSLSDGIKSVVLDSIIEISTTPENPNVLLESNKLFKHIDLNVDLVIPQLDDMERVQSVNLSFNKKRKRSSLVQSVIPSVDILDTLEWKKGVRVLELIQDKKKMSNLKSLVSKLFDILKRCLNFEEQAMVEYPKQLILSLLLLCCQKLEDVKLSQSTFDMELIVQCIRASSNPQTHHHALLVLAHCASLFPTQVLHHIMAIFTFMGSSTLRRDDNYSFQLISSIIDSVIPILVRDGSIDTIISVLRVFVDALVDVPEHRRLKLYTQLLDKIDVEAHLHLFLKLVFVSHVLYGSEENNSKMKYKFEDHSMIKRLNMAIEIVMQFPPSVGFNACKKLIHHLRCLPCNREDLQKNGFEIDISDLSEKQFRNFKYSILIFINNLVSTKEFIGKIAVLSDEDHESLEPYYKDIIVGILSYIQKTHPILDKNQNSHYWKAIQNLSLEILDCMNALLTPEMFLLVMKGLITHDLTSIRKRSLDLLNSKLQYDNSLIEECTHKDLHSTVDTLVAIIGKLNSDINEDEMIVIQKALLSLKFIVKVVGSEDEDKYVEILAFITKLIKCNQIQDYVLSSLILCLVELCVTLKEKTIEYLPSYMPLLLKLLTKEKQSDSPTLLCITLLTAIQKILQVGVLLHFISPYLKKILYELSQLCGKWNSVDDPKLTQVVDKLKMIRSTLAENIPIRLLIPSMDDSYSDIFEKRKLESIGPIMSILSESLRNLSGSDISPHLPELQQFFMNALEFRNSEVCDLEQTNIIENQIIEALCTLVLKLSDSSFRVFFRRIFAWADESEDKNDRIITFYNLTSELARKLNSLFVLFTNIFLNNAAKILDACNKHKSAILYFEDTTKTCLLLEKVLETLKVSFEHTRKLNKDMFELLMQPIVDNLENDLNGMSQLESRNEKLLTPCIVHFAVATADDFLWKQMNYQILLKMRSSNYKIRLISLSCLTEIVKRLGDDFLPLLPETIPFLSELLEDDHEVVQESCKKSIQELEEVLGENLSKYF